MPAEITTPSTANAVDRLTLGTEDVRGVNANSWIPQCSCNCAELDTNTSPMGGCFFYICADTE